MLANRYVKHRSGVVGFGLVRFGLIWFGLI